MSLPVLARPAGPVSSNSPYTSSTLDEAGQLNRLHDVGSLWMNVISNCSFGNESPGSSSALVDPCIGDWAPQAEFPGGSGVQYLYKAGLWVGALIQEEGYDYPRVSTAVEGWFENLGADVEFRSESGISEMTNRADLTNCLGEYITNPLALTEQEFTSVAYDTFMINPNGSAIDHPQDGPHSPLGIKVTQHTYAMASEEYSGIIFLEYTIKNIGNNNLKNPFIALYFDGDVGIASDRQSQHYADDITAFIDIIDDETVNIAYIADNDGRRNGNNTGSDFTAPDVIGVKLFDEHEAIRTSYNWWISNGDPAYDFGPSWSDDGSQGNWTATFGTPITDADKYFLMGNREFDYDQILTDSPGWISENPQYFYDEDGIVVETHDWREVDAEHSTDIANGFDTRFLISWGPFGVFDYADDHGNRVYRLNPGEEASITIAVITGEHFHVNDPQENPEVMDPRKYDTSDLIEKGRRADYLYGNLEELAPPPANENISIFTGYSGIVINWDGIENPENIYSNIYRDGSDTPLNDSPILGNSFTDKDVRYGIEYSYRLQRVKNESILSDITQPISIFYGAPTEVINLTATTEPGTVILSWDEPIQPNIDGYNVLRSTRTGESSYGPFEVIATVEETEYVDDSMELVEYHKYAVQALRDNMPGSSSNPVTVRPIGLSRDLLILSLYSSAAPVLDWGCDEVNEFFLSLFDGTGMEADTMSVSIDDNVSFAMISDYKVIWLNSESSFIYYSSFAGIEELYSYMDAGGRLIVSGIAINSIMDLDRFKDFVGCTSTNYEGIPTVDDSEDFFYSALHQKFGYQNLIIDEELIPDMFGNRLGNSTVFIPQDVTNTIYKYSSESGESDLEDLPIGVIFNGMYENIEYHNAVLGFSLFSMGNFENKQTAAQKIYNDLFEEEEIPESPGTFPIPSEYGNWQVYPNPFNAVTTLEFHLLKANPVELKLYNVLGQVVFHKTQQQYHSGSHKLTIDGSTLSTGLYFIKMTIGQEQSIQKLMLVK